MSATRVCPDGADRGDWADWVHVSAMMRLAGVPYPDLIAYQRWFLAQPAHRRQVSWHLVNLLFLDFPAALAAYARRQV